MLPRPVVKTVLAAAAALGLATAPGGAEETGAEEKLRFSSISTQSSAPLLFPAWVVFDMATRIDDNTRVLGVSGLERVLTDRALDNFRLELAWTLAASSAVSSAAPRPSTPGFAPFIVAGAVLASNSIDHFVNSGGIPFATDGRSRFYGVYAGLNATILGHTARASAASSALALFWNVFANAGWGRGEVDAFNGTFHRSDTGLFYELGTSVQLDFGGARLGPVLTYRFFEPSKVRREETLFGVRLTVPLGEK